MTVDEMFDRHADEFMKFDRIENKLHPRPDLCAMLYLHERFGGEGDAIDGSSHDIAWLDWDPDQLTEEDVIYIRRCGVHLDRATDSLAMFT